MTRSDLFPPIEPYEVGRLQVDDTHSLYWEQCGTAKGAPVVFLHGGPGSGASAGHRRFFDPLFYRSVLFDQRGAGRSTPFGSIENNTTPHLIDDLEKLRERLRIERWLVFGGSWGSTLAIAYAEAHPERVAGLILRGIFLCRRKEIDWFLHGMATFFPEAWRRFNDFLPAAERDDLLGSYYRRLINPDPKIHLPAARAWSTYEGACSTLLPSPETVAAFGEERMAVGLARIEAHYMSHDIFLPVNSLLDNMAALRDIPGEIVQGRYDTVCPIVTADELVKGWPNVRYTIVPDAGHSAMEPGIRAQLVGATERMKKNARWSRAA